MLEEESISGARLEKVIEHLLEDHSLSLPSQIKMSTKLGKLMTAYADRNGKGLWKRSLTWAGGDCDSDTDLLATPASLLTQQDKTATL